MNERTISYPFSPVLQLTKYSPFVNIPDFLSAKECTKVRSLMRGRETFKGRVEGEKIDDPTENKKFRDSTICGLDYQKDTAWIFDRLRDAVVQVNFDIWGYDLFGFLEGIQLARYDTGDFYGWHMDIGNGILSQRKLSIVLQLSDAAEYEGGELEFFQYGPAPREVGTLILFPSFMHHQVVPVSRGIRYSLVAWLSGNPYK